MTTQTRHREDVDHAYALQSKAAIQSAARFTSVGLGLAFIAHRYWPGFRRQTLAFKGFLVSGFTVFGVIYGAETALLAHEAERRVEENLARREARLDLARQGLVGTETEIAKWRAAKDKSSEPPPS